MKHIILIHGAFHTGACWSLVAPLLSKHGFIVQTPTLPGQRGNPRNPLFVSLKSYVDDIIKLAESLDAPATLLGHSLAGFAISAGAERRPELFSRLIYLTAAIPKPGRSTLRDAAPAGPSQPPRMKPSLSVTFPADQAGDFFYNSCTPEMQTKAKELLSPQPLRPMLGTVKSTQARLGSVEKHFFECLHDRVMPIHEQRRKQGHQRFASIETLDTDHSPFFSNPQALTEAILRAVCGKN